MHTRKPASVLPEPVGAAMRVSAPEAMRAHPSACGGVGPCGKRASNHARTAGWKPSSTPAVMFGCSVIPNIRSAYSTTGSLHDRRRHEGRRQPSEDGFEVPLGGNFTG